MTDGRSDRARPAPQPPRSSLTAGLLRTLWPLAAVAGLLALAALAAGHSSIGFTRVDPPADIVPTFEPPEQPVPAESLASAEPGPSGSYLPEWVPYVGTVLCTAVVLAVVVALLWALARDLLRRRRGLARPGARKLRSAEQTAEEVVAALDAGLVELSDTDADPRKAVIACWVRLEQAAAAAGVERRPGDTPTDLVTRLLGAGRPVSADVLAAFADVYREARYATHTVDERMRTQARSALHRLRTELTAGVTG
ncbi:DUF4129 domain-containing protein [Plantactinospora endophytica]|uniref:Protein-glutamine gamma-glutamyltransferase-like C-terminal domain-containing protein n=1 Tax=Plantactinospora endophytica TaxID=673535 RepID=A0ABQ4E575_9ACTN|nr:DUF4129 domain-containing protein [Plantactinospora endophytica]GIG89477.1 hypothetical protein Pen02_44130 [Plantactinospora endophytica]